MWEEHEQLVNSFFEGKEDKTSKNILKSHLEKLSFLQHERLIHLIVTMTVGICTTILYATTFITSSYVLLIPDALLSLLLIAYLLYYRKLENTVQRWYSLIDKIREKKN